MNEDNDIISEPVYHKLNPGDKVIGAGKDVPYYKIGNGNYNNIGQSMNLIQEMTKMSKPELWFFGEIESRIDFRNQKATGEVVLDYSMYTSSQKQNIKKAYILLNNKNIVKRIKRGKFIINPKLILPRDVSLAEEICNEL